jgi:hypothetical protein
MTIPEPHDPDHVPPVKEIQFLCPNGVAPTETRGCSPTDIRKSRLRLETILSASCKDRGTMYSIVEAGLTLDVGVIEKGGDMPRPTSMNSWVWVS